MTTRWPDSRTALWNPGLKNGARRREFYEDRSARISIRAGGCSSRPDTLKQTDQPPISQTPCRRGGPYVYEDRSARISIRAGGCSSRPDTLKQTDQPPISQTPCRRGGPYVFKPLDDPLVLSRMTGPCAHMREAELLQKLSDIARVKVDAEPLGDDPLEIDPTPAHNAVLLTIRPGLERSAPTGPVAPPTGEAWDPPSNCR